MLKQHYEVSIQYLIRHGKIKAGERGKVTHRAISDALKIDPATYRNIMEERRLPRLDTIKGIADVLKVEPWQFLVPGFDPEKPPALVDSIGIPRPPPDPNLEQMLASYSRMDPGNQLRAAGRVLEIEAEARKQSFATAPTDPHQASQGIR